MILQAIADIGQHQAALEELERYKAMCAELYVALIDASNYMPMDAEYRRAAMDALMKYNAMRKA